MVDPLRTVKAAAAMLEAAENLGLSLRVGFDFAEFEAIKRMARDEAITPFFDPAINDFTPENAFWVAGTSDGLTVYLQAFRLDIVDRDFSQWFASWMIGLYGRAGQLLKMTRTVPIATKRERGLRGRVVYTGELWVSQKAPRKTTAAVLETVGQFSEILAYLHFSPGAIWALADFQRVIKGGTIKAGFAYADYGFVEWERPTGEVYKECLLIALKDEVEAVIQRTTL